MNSATKIVQVRAVLPYTLYVTKQDGQEIELDLTPLIETHEAFFGDLKIFVIFATLELTRWTVCIGQKARTFHRRKFFIMQNKPTQKSPDGVIQSGLF
jgi:hypothetical protein